MLCGVVKMNISGMRNHGNNKNEYKKEGKNNMLFHDGGFRYNKDNQNLGLRQKEQKHIDNNITKKVAFSATFSLILY